MRFVVPDETAFSTSGGKSGGHWEHYDHGADIGIRGIGPTKAAAFVQAARAMTAIVTDLETVRSIEPVEARCEAPDDVLLLVDFLNALIYEMAVREMLFAKFEIDIRDGQLKATAWGERINRRRHRPVVEVKGATLTTGAVEFRNGHWIAQCVVDV